jgi:arylsulfatase A-like enzyme/Flp pilus assembly protein TadD
MSLTRWLLCVVWLTMGAVAGASAPPNVILITLDTVRADRMGFLGSQRGLTSNLDALAQQSVVFTRAYSQAPLTPTSHSTILTGTYPQFHKVNDFKVPLAKDLPYAPDLLRASGYRTAAFVGSFALDPAQPFAQGFGRGFDTYDAGFTDWRPGLDRYHTTQRRAHDVVAHALAWLDQRKDGQVPERPFFMWVHLYDAHHPYDPPEPYKTKYAAAPYDGAIAYVDSAVGELLNQLRARGLYDGAVIAVMADHGEALGDHGEDQHGIFLYDETIHVPLMIKLPADAAAGKGSGGERIENQVELVDVLPTILQAVGVAIPKEVQGQSLLELMTSRAKPSSAQKTAESDASSVPRAFRDRPAYSETDYPRIVYGWSSLQSLRSGKYLYVEAPRAELYDQSVDPNAARNLFSTSGAVSGILASQLDAFRQKTTSDREAPPLVLDDRAQRNLGALGYITSGTNDPKAVVKDNGEDKKRLADPKDKIGVANQLAQTTFLTNNFRFTEAIPLLQQLIVKEPGMPLPYGQLGRSYVSVGEYAKAVPVLRKFVELDPDSDPANSHFELGVALLNSGDAAAAVPEFEIVVKKAPRWDQPHLQLATGYAQTRRLREAVTECEAVLETNPNHYGALLLEGIFLVLAKQPEAALPRLERAAALQPKAPEPRGYLGDAFAQLGRGTEAAREWAAAKQLKANKVE